MQMAEGRLIHWINERYSIYAKRANGAAPPWTGDTILQSYRFCNVHRENDKVTKWIARNWRDSNANHPNLTAAMTLARMFNLPDTLAAIDYPYTWDLPSMTRHVKARRASGYKIFNGAYLITTCGVKMDKIDYVFRVADDVYKDRVLRTPCYVTLADYHSRLTNVKGLGDFLAAQIIADLKNTSGHPLQDACDHLTWCAPGPGSMRGLKRLVGSTGVTRGSFMGVALAAWGRIRDRLNPMPGIDMQDFQNCLCEFDKYDRTYLGEGKPKQRYRGV
jgi:hypothetical protein